jgi:hypothetical protein
MKTAWRARVRMKAAGTIQRVWDTTRMTAERARRRVARKMDAQRRGKRG